MTSQRNQIGPREYAAPAPAAALGGLFTLPALFKLIMIISSIAGALQTFNTWRQLDAFQNYQQVAAVAVAAGKEPPVASVMPPDIGQWFNSLYPFIFAFASWAATKWLNVDPKLLPQPLPGVIPQPQPPPPPPFDVEQSGNLKLLQALDTLTGVLTKDGKGVVIDLNLTWIDGEKFHIYFGPAPKDPPASVGFYASVEEARAAAAKAKP